MYSCAGLLEAGLPRRDEVRRDVADQRAAERLAKRVAVERGHDRLAHVDVVERLDVRLERDVAVAAGRRREHELILLIALRGLAQDRRRKLEVARHHARAVEDL